MSDTTAESASNLNDRQQTDAYDVPKSGEDRTIQERMDTRYHPEDILPKISELPKSTPNESSAPKNITIHKLQRKVKLEESLPEAGRSNTAHDTFQKNYTDSLNTRIGTTGSQKILIIIKNNNLSMPWLEKVVKKVKVNNLIVFPMIN